MYVCMTCGIVSIIDWLSGKCWGTPVGLLAPVASRQSDVTTYGCYNVHRRIDRTNFQYTMVLVECLMYLPIVHVTTRIPRH